MVAQLMKSAAYVGVSKKLQKKTWNLLGDHEAADGDHAAAIISYSSAHILDYADKEIFAKIINEASYYFRENLELFSISDLVILLQPIERLLNYYQYHEKSQDSGVASARELKRQITAMFSTAPDRKVTPVTHTVYYIYSALYPNNMSQEEVRAEFARLFVEMNRDEYERRVREKRKATKKSAHGNNKPQKKPKNNKDSSR